jgi:hypothetical protein
MGTATSSGHHEASANAAMIPAMNVPSWRMAQMKPRVPVGLAATQAPHSTHAVGERTVENRCSAERSDWPQFGQARPPLEITLPVLWIQVCHIRAAV